MVYRQLDGNIGELKFYGNISEWWISGEDFDRTIEEMSGKYKQIEVRTHCYGGSVFEGNVMCNTLTRCKSKKLIHIDGVAASMMGIVMQYFDEIICAENGFVMIHCPTCSHQGNAKQMLEASKLMTSMEKNFVKVLMRRTGKPEKEIMQLFDGNDHWFSAEEALAYGLITKISEPIANNIIQLQKPTDNGQIESVFNRYAALLTAEFPINTNQKESLNMKKELIAKFGLTGVTENSTDAEITAALEAHMKATATSSETVRDTAVEAVIKGMESATGKAYEATVRAHLVTVGKTAGFEALQAMLGISAATAASAAIAQNPATATPAAATVPQVINLLGNGSAVSPMANDRSSWNWDKWQAEDQAGLEEMEKTKPESFIALYKKEFGVTPTL